MEAPVSVKQEVSTEEDATESKLTCNSSQEIDSGIPSSNTSNTSGQEDQISQEDIEKLTTTPPPEIETCSTSSTNSDSQETTLDALNSETLKNLRIHIDKYADDDSPSAFRVVNSDEQNIKQSVENNVHIKANSSNSVNMLSSETTDSIDSSEDSTIRISESVTSVTSKMSYASAASTPFNVQLSSTEQQQQFGTSQTLRTTFPQAQQQLTLNTSTISAVSSIASGTSSTPYKLRHKWDFDEMIQVCKKCKYLPEPDMRRLCDYVCDILAEESNVQSVQSPVTICGDIHGQFYDLLELFRTTGQLPSTNYVFLGDFVDRGYYSLETFTYLLVLKARYPHRMTLLRGNHESRQITQVYGFYDECLTKYGNVNVWRACTRVFDLLTVAALIDNTILCLHGGLSPDVRTIDQIRIIDRKQEVPHQGAFCDIVWSDPDDVENWQTSPRGAGYLFGQKQTDEFLEINTLELIARAHQLVTDGLRYQFEEHLVTVWSAPNYCYRCNNLAATLTIASDGSKNTKYFQAVPNSQRVIPPKTITPYFL